MSDSQQTMFPIFGGIFIIYYGIARGQFAEVHDVGTAIRAENTIFTLSFSPRAAIIPFSYVTSMIGRSILAEFSLPKNIVLSGLQSQAGYKT